MAVAPLPTPQFQIAPDLAMNASEACTQTLGAIAAKGGGKSYLASVFVEQLHAAGAPFCVFDPIGNWHALTLAADGKGPGLGIVVVGGERADVPLVEDAAEALGAYLVRDGVSAVLDVSELSKSRRKVYVATVAEAMFRAARKAKRPYMVVLEEAQLFAPQVCPPGEQRMLGAITDIVRLGRNHGLGSMLVTQRPQSVSKEVLNQVECLFVGQLRGPQERKAIAGWISEQSADDARAGLDELPKLSPGEFFCWSPSWLRVFKRIRVTKKQTFDGSSTPTLGQGRRALPAKGSRAGLSSVIEALSALGPEKDEPVQASVRSDDLVLPARLVAVEAERDEARARLLSVETTLLQTREHLAKIIEAIDHRSPAPSPRNVPLSAGLRAQLEARTEERQQSKRLPDEKPLRAVPNDIDGPMRKLLTVLVTHGMMDKRKLALLAGYSSTGGGFLNPLGRLRSAGFCTGSDPIVPTNAGVRAIGKVETPPLGRALLEWWLQHPRVDGPMSKILRALADARHPLTPAELAERAHYTPNTGGFTNPLGRLRTIGLVAGGRGEKLSLAPELRG